MKCLPFVLPFMLSRLGTVAQSADSSMEPLRCHKNAVAAESSIENTVMGGTPIARGVGHRSYNRPIRQRKTILAAGSIVSLGHTCATEHDIAAKMIWNVNTSYLSIPMGLNSRCIVGFLISALIFTISWERNH